MLSLKEVSFSYGEGDVLKNVSLTVERGQSVGVIGANGAGKSTLFSLICGINLPVSGEIAVDDIVMSKKTVIEIRKHIGMVFQDPDDQLFMPTVYDDVAFSLRNAGMDEERVRERTEHVLKHLDIEGIAERPPYRLSGGEKRRAAIAGAIALKPDYLLLDEPTAFLDPRSKREFYELYESIDCARIIASHDLDTVKRLCKRVVILHEGSIAYDGSADVLENEGFLIKCGL